MPILLCVDSEKTKEALLENRELLIAEIVDGIGPRGVDERELVMGIVANLAHRGVLTKETLASGEVDRHSWAISLVAYDRDQNPPFRVCVETFLSDAVMKSLPIGLQAKFDQDAAATFDSEFLGS